MLIESLRLSASSRKDASVGEIVNLIQINTQIFVDLAPMLHFMISSPFQIILAVFTLWAFIGPSAFVAFGVMILLIPFTSIMSILQNKVESEKLKIKDNRLKLINDILNGIKVLKYYGWELSFKKIVNKIRETELKILKRHNILFGISEFSFNFSSFLVNVITIVTYFSLTLFNMIRMPLYFLPLLGSSLIQVNLKFFIYYSFFCVSFMKYIGTYFIEKNHRFFTFR